MQTRAIFTGSFDPFTKGHADIVERALTFVDDIVIGIGINERKQAMFTPAERQKMIQALYENEPRVSVHSYSGLTTDFAKEVKATFILRSLRSIKDYEYELTMADINKELSGIETLVLFTNPHLSNISSSVVRELIHFGKDVTAFLPEGFPLIQKDR